MTQKIAYWTLIAACAGLAGCTDASEGSTEETMSEVAIQYLELGMSQPFAVACAELSGVMVPESLEGAPEGLADGEEISLWWTRRDFRQMYCDEFSLGETGWEHCIQEATSFTTFAGTPACLEQALPYVECLAQEETTTRDDCRKFLPTPGCDPTVPVISGMPADDYCGLGGMGSVRGMASVEGVWCAPGQACDPRLSYRRNVNDCPDGSSYELFCAWPDESCGLTCECRKDDELIKEVLVESVRSASFDHDVWVACAFPEIPAEVVAEWNASLPTESVYENTDWGAAEPSEAVELKTDQ